MIQTFTCALALVEYGVSSVTAPDQEESGDRHLVKTTRDGALIAVVDGSGHGKDAAAPARLAIETVEADAHGSIPSLFQRCHERLRGTRGAVISMASIHAAQDTFTWAGVGNIEGMVVRFGAPPEAKVERLLLRPGIVGYRLPPLQAAAVPIAPGDLIILATDGIRPDVEPHILSEEHPRIIANKISANFCKRSEDGLILVVSYLGNRE